MHSSTSSGMLDLEGNGPHFPYIGPKKAKGVRDSEFRHIECVNLICKLLTKLLVSKNVASKLISPNKIAFI